MVEQTDRTGRTGLCRRLGKWQDRLAKAEDRRLRKAKTSETQFFLLVFLLKVKSK